MERQKAEFESYLEAVHGDGVTVDRELLWVTFCAGAVTALESLRDAADPQKWLSEFVDAAAKEMGL